MDAKKRKLLLFALIAIAMIILIGVGATFAYFNATISSNENAVSVTAAEFKIDLEDDISLIKSNVIPSIEEYVDIASKRVDSDGNFLKPYENEDGKTITDGTVCIDDNLNEICSVYTFTVINSMTDNDLPLYMTLNPSINTFENLYFKVLDDDLNEVISATRLIDDRYEIDSETGGYLKDDNGNLIKKANFDELTASPVVLTNINKTLVKAQDENTPSTVTYSIVIWIMETGKEQNETDAGKVFASTLHINASGANGKGITGMISAAGEE